MDWQNANELLSPADHLGLTPAAKDNLLGLHTAVVSLLLAEFPALLVISFAALAHTEHCTGYSHVTCKALQLLGF